MSDVFDRDPCDGCDGTCGDVCPVFEAQRPFPGGHLAVCAERDRLREAEKQALQLKDEAERCVKDLLAENDRLVGEVERLREALREIAEAEGFERADASDEIDLTTPEGGR